MTQTYHIQGMTCNGCKDSVTRAFQSLEGVHQVHVDLEKGHSFTNYGFGFSNQVIKRGGALKIYPD